MNILEIIVLAIIGLCGARGWMEGFVKTTFRFVLNVAVLAVSIFITPVLLRIFFRQLLLGGEAPGRVLPLLVIFALLKYAARLAVTALDLLAKLPVLKTLNRLLGLGTGLLQGALLICLVFLLASALSATQFGSWVQDMSRTSSWLSALYANNPIQNIVAGYFMKYLSRQ
ncbi:MAG: CvpA family protein [Lachnospiraceae bacterium]|nr:CvpA family protein [Lachnospiraceae bacterium]